MSNFEILQSDFIEHAFSGILSRNLLLYCVNLQLCCVSSHGFHHIWFGLSQKRVSIQKRVYNTGKCHHLPDTDIASPFTMISSIMCIMLKR